MTGAPRVIVAGGGLAGITAALRLAERGYRVKLYEQKSMLGGNLASRPAADGMELDVYPHMFLPWYHNFWRLMQDAGVDRDEGFVPLEAVKQLRQGEYPRFMSLVDGYSPRHVLRNLFSGVGPPADMFVFWYANIDLLAERLHPTMLLDDVSVTGFLHARPYMTERAAKAFDSWITMVWAIPSYLASAEDYRTYLAYSVSNYDPPYLLAKGSALRQVIAPLTAAMELAGVEVESEVEVRSVSCVDGRVREIGLRRARFDDRSYTWVGEGEEWTEEVDELVLAVPPQVLSSLVRENRTGSAVVEVVPLLAELSRLRSQRIPIVHVYFNRKLPQMPPEPVGLYGSRLALAFTDISQTWTASDGLADTTVLSVSASEPYALPGTGPHDDGFAILRELRDYVDFDLGTQWGESSDIDWERTRYEPNDDSQLFVNETGTDIWRPAATCSDLSNLYFAGNFCANRIGMMTVESAVASGLEAARAMVARRGFGAPVEIIEPNAGANALYVALRWAYGPSALAAKALSTGSDWLRRLRPLLTPAEPPRGQRRDS
ncbi:MAG TPA: FAD-dependent oxidoreductase [Thermoleophilaceae bacterium]|nr:FAD-dependent oxidoreductase [Thermoleophilaceae bacterium]